MPVQSEISKDNYKNIIDHLVQLVEGTNDATIGFSSKKDTSDIIEGDEMPDKKFNIFQVAKIWKAEEIHTLVIAELINPQSSFHDYGAIFLDKFLQKIGIQLPDEELKDALVTTEVPTSKGRRIDMVISTANYYLPFEVKIWSRDQDTQLWDYYQFAQEQKKKTPAVYYLTPDGHKPSPQSCLGLTDKQFCQLSFKKHILPWLEDCINVCKENPDVLSIMRQLHDNIQGRTDIRERPGTGPKNFSLWNSTQWNREKDVLVDIYDKLSNLPWTECTNDYMTFTLRQKKFEETALEFALRVCKESNNKMQLFLICGITREDGKPNYASAGDYISEHKDHFKALLNHTFREDDFKAQVKSGKTTWNRLPKDGYTGLDADQCYNKIMEILQQTFF